MWEKFGTQTVNVQVTDPSQQNVVQQKSHITQQKHSSQNQACPGLCLCLEVGHDKHKQQERENDCQGQVEEEQLQYDPPRRSRGYQPNSRTKNNAASLLGERIRLSKATAR